MMLPHARSKQGCFQVLQVAHLILFQVQITSIRWTARIKFWPLVLLKAGPSMLSDDSQLAIDSLSSGCLPLLHPIGKEGSCPAVAVHM